MENENKSTLEEDLLKITKSKFKSAQDKYNALQTLAKKYNMPLEKMLKNIIMEWVNDDKEKKFNTFKPKNQNK